MTTAISTMTVSSTLTSTTVGSALEKICLFVQKQTQPLGALWPGIDADVGDTDFALRDYPPEQQRFLLPFAVAGYTNAPTATTAIASAVKNLSAALESGQMPALSAVGQLDDEPQLLAFVEAYGNKWLKAVGQQHVVISPITTQNVVSGGGGGAAALAALEKSIVHLCCGRTVFEPAVSVLPPSTPLPATSGLVGDFTGDVTATLTALKDGLLCVIDDDRSSTKVCRLVSNVIVCRLVAARLLFGFRVTVGTITAIGAHGFSLPQRRLLEQCFHAPHCPPREIISVGARALAKHVHRDNSLSWWGNHHLKGTQSAKNEAAGAILARILDGCDGGGGGALESAGSSAWRNFHVLPHGFIAYEVRVPEGYGARWQLDTRARCAGVAGSSAGEEPADASSFSSSPATTIKATESSVVEMSPNDLTFRGFLEPHDQQGHVNGWRH